MENNIIVLSNAESCIYCELLKARTEWFKAYDEYYALKDSTGYELERVFNKENYYCKRYLELRDFVRRAFNVETETIEGILDGKYTIVCEEAIDIQK